MRTLKIGGIYRHFKGNLYIVLDKVIDIETYIDNDNYKELVIYQALYGEHMKMARPYDMFMSEVDKEKYPNVKQKYRFEEVDEVYAK